MHVLITGGAGFIGAHTANELLQHGHCVRVLDSLIPQVHGPERKRPGYLAKDVEFILGDIRDETALVRALDRVDAVIHLVALVGVGQSMYQIAEYTGVNDGGTAQLLQVLCDSPVERLLVASSMSIYGEGEYCNSAGQRVHPPGRTLEQLRMGVWELLDEKGEPLTPIATTEEKQPALASIYALTKYDQERMCLIMGGAYGMRATALRFFNTYGPFQALSNPYTGVLSNFATRILNHSAPLIYEDGLQLRDFVSVYDVARACRLALESDQAAGLAINISTGMPLTVKSVAEQCIQALGSELQPEITGKYRSGDIRHCFADVYLAKKVLNWTPQVTLEHGLRDLAAWLEGQTAVDRGVEARKELAARGLMI